MPGLGDATGAVLAAWILVEAIRHGASRATLTRIAFNLTLDAVIGAIPILGDVFDFIWKGNLRNLKLLERHLADPVAARKADRLFVLVLCGAILLLCGALVAGSGLIIAQLVHLTAGLFRA